MIRGSVWGVAAAIALPAITPCLADAATMQCPGVIPAGNPVGAHGWIVAATGTAPSGVRAAYAKLRDDVPPSKLSQGAAMILNPAWTLAIVPCAQPA
jgi:hypothetical protein